MAGFSRHRVDPHRLAQRLSEPTPLPRPKATASLAYGRHRGPAPMQARRAAVAVALYQRPDDRWMIPLTLRPTSLQHHGGQICFPGGQVERGESVVDAALREFEEELGVTPRVLHHCGPLSTQYVYASDNLVHPTVAILECPGEPWQPDPTEVEAVIELPLDVVMSPQSRTRFLRTHHVRRDDQVIDQFSFSAPAIEFAGHQIWGATALMLDQLAQVLHEVDASIE